MTPTIALRDVTVIRGRTLTLDDVSLTVAPGEILAVLGPSGSGKTTLLRAIMGFVSLCSGSVTLAGRVVSDGRRVIVPPEARDLAVVFQSLALWPHLTVAGNLEFVLRSKGLPRDQCRRNTERMLQEVGLLPLAARYPAELSGGEQQRVAIARALVLAPSAVLLDEPLSNLDIGLKEDLLAMFRRLFQAHRVTGIHVTHDPREARHIGDRVAVLEQGRIVFTGPLDALDPHAGSPFIRRIAAYLQADPPPMSPR